MARLPTPSHDSGTWGGILNDFLSQAHNPDGTLKSNSVMASQLAPGSVTSAALATGTVATTNLADNAITNLKLDAPTQAIITSVAAKYLKPATGIPVTDLTTATQASLLRASSAIQSINTKTPNAAGAISLTAADVGAVTTTDLAAKAPLLSPTFSGTVTVPTPTNGSDAATKGYVDGQVVSGSTPDATPTTKGKLQLTGDLAGTASSPTVAKLSGVTLPGLAPTAGQVLTATSASATSWTAPASAPVSSVAGKVGVVTLTATDVGAIPTTDKGTASGVATLDGTSHIPTAQLPDLSTTYATTSAVTTEATTARANEAKAVPRWTPTTTYTAGQQVVSPGNDVVSAKISFTSGASYDSTKWQLSGTYAPLTTSVVRTWNARKQAAFERDNAVPGTVFIDSVYGLDTNTGATPALAYQTIAKLTIAGVVAGSRIMLRRGSTFTIGAFTVPVMTGTPGPLNRTIFGAYGAGPQPIITGNIFNVTQSYIDVQDIHFQNCSTGYALFVYAAGQVDNRIKRCEIGPHIGSGGIIMGVAGGLVEDCNIHDCWNNIEYPSGGGFALFLTTGTDSTEVRYNTVTNCYKGLSAGNTHRDALFHHNVIVKCRVNGMDMSGGGVVNHPPRLYNNFVWHNPTTPNGHGIDTQSSAVGPIWRNNIVYCDYTGAAGNVELYTIDSTTYASVDVDYNLGYCAPGTVNAPYAKWGTTTYQTLALYQASIAGSTALGKEVHSLDTDPLIASFASGLYFPLPGSPAMNAGVVVGGVNDQYFGTAPDLGAYEVA